MSVDSLTRPARAELGHDLGPSSARPPDAVPPDATVDATVDATARRARAEPGRGGGVA